MYNLKIDPQGSPLVFEIKYLGHLPVSYIYTLWRENSNQKVEEKSGNNLNTQDDIYQLPLPTADHVGRLIELFSTISNTEQTTSKTIVALNIKQGHQLLFTDEGPSGIKTGGLTYTVVEEVTVEAGKSVLNNPFILLK